MAAVLFLLLVSPVLSLFCQLETNTPLEACRYIRKLQKGAQAANAK